MEDYDLKLQKKSKYIDELKERNRHLKKESEELQREKELQEKKFKLQLQMVVNQANDPNAPSNHQITIQELNDVDLN